MNSLPGDSTIYTADEKNISKQFESACPAPKNLKVKVGAKVLLCMTVSNTMCSGMLGEVVECSSDKLSVCLNDHVHRFDRVNFVYAGISGARYQYPFRLAFALTVHRAQGLTLNSLVVHASRMTWPGQLGVAIGRAKCINGLQVIGFGEGLKIKSQPEEVVKFYDQSGTFDCICLNEEDPPTQSTLSAVSSQATAAEEFDDYEDVTPEIVPDLDILCPEQDENEWNREAQLFNKERNRLLRRCDSLKKFVGTIKSYMSRKLSVCKDHTKLTNKKQTAFFAEAHQFFTSQNYSDQVKNLFGRQPTKHHYSVAYTIACNIRDTVVKATLKLDEDLQSFLAAPSSDIAMANIKYIAGFCIYGVRKKKRASVLHSIRSKRSKRHPLAIDYAVSLLDSLEDQSGESTFNEEIDRKQFKGCHLFVPNEDVVLFFNFVNGKIREYETVRNIETVGPEFYTRIEEDIMSCPEAEERFHKLFHKLEEHEFLVNKQNQQDLHNIEVSALMKELVFLFLNMSARAFRKEYIRLKGVQREEARRKQVKIKGVAKSKPMEPKPLTSETVVQDESNSCVCVVCSTDADEDTICCDKCNTWCHFDCVGVDHEMADTINVWFCPICVARIE